MCSFHPSTVFTRPLYAFRSYLGLGNLDRFCHRLNTPCLRQIMRNWEVWKTNIEKSNNHRILQLLGFHAQQTVQDTSAQDLDPRPCADNVHTSVLHHEMMTIEPGENPTRTLTWKPLAYLRHVKCRTNDDRFPFPLGDLVLFQPWCTNSDSDWTCSTVCLHTFQYDYIWGPSPDMTNSISSFTGSRLGLFISWVHYSVLWVTKLRSTR